LAQFQFNPNQYQVQKPLEKLPRGWYPVVIDSSEIQPTAKKDGFKLVCTFLVIDGPSKGRKITNSYNIDNPSAQAVEIAMSEIKTICSCVGIFVPINASEELHGKPLQVLVTEPKDSEYNDIKGYKTIDGTDADKVGPGAGAPAQYAQPAHGYGGQPQYQQPQQGYGAPQQSQYAQQPPQGGAAPAWAPPAQQPQAPAQAAPAWAPPQQAAQQPAAYQAPQAQQPQSASAPAWSPSAQPAAPAWAPQR
jgi:hypothetical protein